MYNKDFDVMIKLVVRGPKDNYFHDTTSFLEIREVIFTTPGELYTSYEKLWLPFDDTIWKYLIISFALAFVAILVINRLPLSVRKSVFGDDPRIPALNVISTFYGIPQFKLPVNNIPRFVLILCVFFCLIFRTCYQSKMFEFMTNNPRRPPPKTVQDLKDKGYQLLLNYYFYYDEDIFRDKNQW
jgi:hypothetical protein